MQDLESDLRNPEPYAIGALFKINQPETRNPKPETRNPKSETRNPKPETRNPKPCKRERLFDTKKRNPNLEPYSSSKCPESGQAAGSCKTTPLEFLSTLEASSTLEALSTISSGRAFIMNMISHRELVPFLQKLCERLQCPGEESYS